MEEQFILLGNIENTLFFYNEVKSANLDKLATFEIFNVLKRHNMLDPTNDVLILYQKNLDGTYTCYSLQHNSKLELEDFDRNDLEQVFNNTVTSLTTKEYLVIELKDKDYSICNKTIEFNNMEPVYLSNLENVLVKDNV
jgi:hypothetical protein